MAFMFRLVQEEGTRRPPGLRTAVSAWSPGETIPLGRDRILGVTEGLPATEVDQDPCSSLSRPNRFGQRKARG